MLSLEMLTAYVMSAMASWIPLEQHAFYEPREVTEARYQSIAADIAEVALDSSETPLFAGDDGRAKTALLLASIASYESSFNAKVDDCRVSGDNGRAHGLWQTHATKTVVCLSRQSAARVALGMVRESFAECRRQSMVDKLAFYTDGFCRHDWRRSRLRVGRAVSYWAEHRELVASEGPNPVAVKTAAAHWGASVSGIPQP